MYTFMHVRTCVNAYAYEVHVSRMCARESIHGRMHDEGTEEKTRGDREEGRREGNKAVA